MSRARLLPLLLAAALSLSAAGCGGDDDKPSTTSASTPSTTSSTSSSTTSPTTTTDPEPTTTDQSSTTKTSETEKTPTTSTPSTPLQDYTKGGSPADDKTADEVRAAMREFLTAVSKGDAKLLCSRIIGFDEVAKKLGQKDVSCESLLKNSANGAVPPSKQVLAGIDKAKVTIKGDRATLGGNVGPPMRKVDGVWKIDYGALVPAVPGH
ncbi:hypothetical protein PAI11_23730 [Patulibacter medicamentivorans]|uniref:DUF4878 domain-containing protein n=1 Tax=Patulibacter medicamentivorans TaxID=1097667 RepID=H0E6C3_9ACTN|nr:hypothetical protein [Patulibacter medicamentivorans]EHN10767.1 hypothetical protein PAI11_23730 [Patulibacter medicamentivorans]